MLEYIEAVEYHNHLTPNMREKYSDFKEISSNSYENIGYYTYEALSMRTKEIHQIRALNIRSNLAESNINQAITLFLQETLKLCTISPNSILIDTFEFSSNKICYALKPGTYLIEPSPQNLNGNKLFTSLVTDLSLLNHFGDIQIPASKVHQIKKAMTTKTDDASWSPSYFVQDWIDVVWNSHSLNQGLKESVVALFNEKENVYQLALSLLEVAGVMREEVQAFLQTSSKFFEIARKRST